MLQLGWKAGTEQYPPDELLDYAIAAEEAGLDSIEASDHFHPWALFTEKIYTPRMSEQNGKVVGSDTVKQSVCISADPEDHIEFAQKYIDLGFDHIIFHSAGPDQRAFIEGYGKHVLPQLRRRRQPKARSAA